MSINLMLVSIIFSIFIISFVLFLLKKERVSIKYSLIWLVVFLVLLVALIIPGFMGFLTNHLGFQTPSNMVLSLLISSLIVINIVLTVIVSSHDKKIRLLIQEVSILNDKVRKFK